MSTTKIVEDFEAGKFKLKLIAPSILVQVLPRPNTSSFLIIPDAHQNSPTREAVVIDVFNPKEINYNGKSFFAKPTVAIGDRVLMPWWAGRPLDGLSDRDWDCPYRIVRDRLPYDPMDQESQGIMCAIEPSDPNALSIQLAETIKFRDFISVNELVNRLFRNYHITPRDAKPIAESANPHKHDV